MANNRPDTYSPLLLRIYSNRGLRPTDLDARCALSYRRIFERFSPKGRSPKTCPMPDYLDACQGLDVDPVGLIRLHDAVRDGKTPFHDAIRDGWVEPYPNTVWQTSTALTRGVVRRLRRLRQDRGLSLRDTAAAIGVSRPWVNLLESGRIQRPDIADLAALAEAYGTTLDVVLAAELAHKES